MFLLPLELHILVSEVLQQCHNISIPTNYNIITDVLGTRYGSCYDILKTEALIPE